jgi:NTP pyrophosphatase (non-canonical NTP hydrolase)
MHLSELTERALAIRKQYEALEQKTYGRSWTEAEIFQGLVGDIGDLAKLVATKSGIRDVPDVDARLAHELSDCLWSILVLAAKYNVNLESSFLKTMDELEKRIADHQPTA